MTVEPIIVLLGCLLVASCTITNPICQGKRYLCPIVEATEQSMTCVTIADPLLKVHYVHPCPDGYVCNYDRTLESLSNMNFSCV